MRDVEDTGVDELRRIREQGPGEKLVPILMEDKGIPRQGMAIEEGGEVTSGTLSPILEQGIALGYVRADRAEPETEVTIDLRGRPRRARIVTKPFVRGRET